MAQTMKRIAVLCLAATIILSGVYEEWQTGWALALTITFATITYHFVMRLLVGWAVDGTMHNQADYTKGWFQMNPFEEKLYKRLKVKKWKDKMPTYDKDIFSLEKHSFDEIAQAMCQSEIVHEIIVVLSFLPILASIWFGAFPVFLITSIAAAGIDLCYVMIQRYNRPRIIRLIHKK